MKIVNNPKKYKKDSHLKYSCQYHVVFCPKYRRKVLIDGVDERLKELVMEKQDDYGYEVIDMEVMPDHVHLLLDVNPKIGIYKIISKIKGYTSNVMRKEFKSLRTRIPTLWTLSRFISSVGSVSLETIKKYIEDQKGV